MNTYRFALIGPHPPSDEVLLAAKVAVPRVVGIRTVVNVTQVTALGLELAIDVPGRVKRDTIIIINLIKFHIQRSHFQYNHSHIHIFI